MTNNTIVTDKFTFVQKLETRGFSREQAEGIAEAVNDVALAQLVTKGRLRDALASLKIDIYKFLFGAMAAQTALIVASICWSRTSAT